MAVEEYEVMVITDFPNIEKKVGQFCKETAKKPVRPFTRPRLMPTKITDDPIAPRLHPEGLALATQAIKRAPNLVCIVRDEGPDTIGAYLDRLNTQELYALIVCLAAMVPDNQSVNGLLSWLPATEEVA